MIAYKLSILVVLAFLGATNAQTIAAGSCPQNINVMDDFSVKDYLGKWYEQFVYPNWFERNGKCVWAEYTLKYDGNVGIFNQLINNKTHEVKNNEGTGMVADNGKLDIVFAESPYNAVANYWILDTDYNSYSVVYSCKQLTRYAHLTFAWILTRKQHPCEETIKTAEQIISDNGFSIKDLVMTDQSDC